jgi:hypothetical protein
VQKNHYSLGIGLTMYKSIGRNVRLYASEKVRDTQYCKVLKSFCAPLATKFTYKKKSGEKTVIWGRDLARNTYTLVN